MVAWTELGNRWGCYVENARNEWPQIAIGTTRCDRCQRGFRVPYALVPDVYSAECPACGASYLVTVVGKDSFTASVERVRYVGVAAEDNERQERLEEVPVSAVSPKGYTWYTGGGAMIANAPTTDLGLLCLIGICENCHTPLRYACGVGEQGPIPDRLWVVTCSCGQTHHVTTRNATVTTVTIGPRTLAPSSQEGLLMPTDPALRPATTWEIARIYATLKAQAEWDQVKAFVAKWCDEAQTKTVVVSSESNYNDEYYEDEKRVASGVMFDYQKPAWDGALDGADEKSRRALTYTSEDFWQFRVTDGVAQANYQEDVGQLPLGTFDLSASPPGLSVTLYLQTRKDQPA